MANTLDGFVVIQIGTGSFTLTPSDVSSPSAALTALKHLQVEFSDDAGVEIGVLSDALTALTTAFGFAQNTGLDPSGALTGAIQEIETAVGSSGALSSVISAIGRTKVLITRIVIDAKNKHYTFGIALDFQDTWPASFPVKLQKISVTINHQS